jgi:glycosyltransferase involved in cell wall biosynthesis
MEYRKNLQLSRMRFYKALNWISEKVNPTYKKWIKTHSPSKLHLEIFAAKVDDFAYKPLISVLMPTFNTPKTYLEKAIESVRRQVYPKWELCVVDDASTFAHVWETITHYKRLDARIKATRQTENGHICRASNVALTMCTGEYVALLDHDDMLSPDALYHVVELLNRHPETDMIYSDEDKIDSRGGRHTPYFKPDWCPDSFLSRMYTCHLGVYRRSLIEKIGGFRVGYEGSQDYDLVLRLTELTQRIRHIPKILYHWRIHPNSTAASIEAKPYALAAAKKSLSEALQRRKEPGRVLAFSKSPYFIIRYEITRKGKVSILIPTRDQSEVLQKCLDSIFRNSSYSDFEVIVIDNGSIEDSSLETFAQWKNQEPERIRCIRMDAPFNYSKLNNYGVRASQGEYLLFLNDDTEVISSDWIEAMIEQSQRPSIGAVGAKLLYPNDTIQHGGIVAGMTGVAGHGHRGFPYASSGYFNHLMTVNNYSAVTGACLMCRRDAYDAVGGFNEELQVSFNDVDFCFKLLKAGTQNVWLPHVVLYHHESRSRGPEDTLEKRLRLQKESDYMFKRWGHIIESDPCYNPNLTRRSEDYKISI